jgi:hypothetical protein
MPSLPMVMPSDIETVLNSIGVPPASRTPCLICSARCRRWKLQGPISVQVFATPMMGLLRSASEKPMAFSMARAGARLAPSVMAPLCHLPVDFLTAVTCLLVQKQKTHRQLCLWRWVSEPVCF